MSVELREPVECLSLEKLRLPETDQARIGKRRHTAERRTGVISRHVLDLCSPMQACAAEGSIPTTRQHQSKLPTSSDLRAIQANALRLSSSEAGVSPRQTLSVVESRSPEALLGG